jgi:hypothetical protein
MRKQDTSFTRYWFLTIDDDIIDVESTQYMYVFYLISSILDHPQGWKKLGYNFRPINTQKGIELRKLPFYKQFVFHLRLSSEGTIQEKCNFDKLSCADMSSNNIYFNETNWIYGTIESEMSAKDLRIYCINHEIGHLLGRYHKDCENVNLPCSIMLQQTIKKQNCCRANVFPLIDD